MRNNLLNLTSQFQNRIKIRKGFEPKEREKILSQFTPAGESEDEEPPETARKRTVTSRIIDVSRGISADDREVVGGESLFKRV